jgi:alpha-1,6-mannosyltransferase
VIVVELYGDILMFFVATIALAQFLPAPNPKEVEVRWRQNLGVFLFVFAAVVFRSEVALLLAMQLLHLLMIPRMSLQQIVPTGIKCALIALLISIPIDSFFWQKPLWPELWGFYYNAIQGKASDWGTSRYPHYFSSLLPRLLLNPLIMILLIPLSLSLPAIQRRSLDLVVPSFLFIAVYSLQPHKESRFIIYVVPPLTGAAALSASFIWTRRSKTLLYRLGSLLLVFSILASFAASTLMLFISSLNYPGGEAITSVRNIMNRTTQWPEDHNDWERIYVHMDVLSCMTGVTRFQEIPSRTAKIAELPIIAGVPTYIVYDKEENKDKLLDPAFWEQFDYALMEEPGKAIGKWEVVDTIYGLAGMEILRPGQGDGFEARLYAANSVPRRNGVMDSEDVREAADEPVDLEAGSVEEGSVGMESLIGLGERLLSRDVSRYAKYSLVKDIVRSITGGYWIGPRMEPAIRILKRVKDSSTSS